MRKSSWGGALSHRYGDLNKENLALKESEEDEDEQSDDGEGSDRGAMRRSSRGTTILGNMDVGGNIDEGTEWTGSVDGEDRMDEAAGVVLYEPSGEVA
jgi:hypothetical protein